MKPQYNFYKLAIVALLVLMFLTGMVDAVSFSMEKKNATTAYASISDGATVYRGDTVRLTPSGGSSYEWSFGDGFTSNYSVVEHTFSFGKRPIVMHNGYILLGITCKANDGSTATKIINFTTPLPEIIKQVETLTTLNESLSRNYTEALTGNRTAPPGWSGFDWVRGVQTTIDAYVSGAGDTGLGMTLFLIIVFTIPFIMNWIIMKDFIVSGILGGFLGVFIIVRLPANVQPIAVAFIVMSVVAVIYSLLKET